LLWNRVVDYKEISIMKITVCIGSSCHIKGSRQVLEGLQSLIRINKLADEVELAGTFCMGKCQLGVCVRVDDSFYSVTPDTVNEFFMENILEQIKYRFV
jgi:NADH:ubiquinone oxidoreductase subunit E